MTAYPKRLIEVDLPIKRVSVHARREKSIRHGHISTLHIWWARRPLAACRAVLCAALWPDPADDLCPPEFRAAVARALVDFAETARTNLKLTDNSPESFQRWQRTTETTMRSTDPKNWPDMRYALLDFIADFANWDNSTSPAYLQVARALTQAAHEALGGLPETRPLVVDPFAGGGSIPLEALRIGADAFASDLNPVAVLLNKVVLEYIPRYGQAEFSFANPTRATETVTVHGLAEAVRYWGEWIKREAERELAEFYPKDPDGATPIAYLWARTIISEGPDDGTGMPIEVPLIRSFWLAKKKGQNKALRWVRDEQGQVMTETVTVTYTDGVTHTVRRPLLEIFEPQNEKEVAEGVVDRGNATCPVTNYTTSVESVRRQLIPRMGGANDARLFAVVTIQPHQSGRIYRLSTPQDEAVVVKAVAELQRRMEAYQGELSLVPDEPTPQKGGSFSQRIYGMNRFCDLFTSRQLLALTTLVKLVRQVENKLISHDDGGYTLAIQTCLAFAVDKQADLGNSLNRWEPIAQCPRQLFARQAVPMVWDFAESTPLGTSSGSFEVLVSGIVSALTKIGHDWLMGQSQTANATAHPLPNGMSQCFFTDPPYYDSVQYANLSDFFIVWFKRTIGDKLPLIFSTPLSPKDEECIVDLIKGKDNAYFERTMQQAMTEGRRILSPHGIGMVVFAHKSTAGWETQLQAMVNAGWTITGSWPIDTENSSRMNAIGTASLASSIHLVCRPRQTDIPVGDWREVLYELPQRIHAWLPRLASAGVVGADAIFACLGPALEIYSRYDRVETASGEVVTLGEYLEYVWAAVSKEALATIFKGVDTSNFAEDARLTAMWLWTLSMDSPEAETGDKVIASLGYTLEYDTARKIAQGLGANLPALNTLVELKGDKARLLAVRERMESLFGLKDLRQLSQPAAPKPRAPKPQRDMFTVLGVVEEQAQMAQLKLQAQAGQSMLDRVHQAMLLFANGQGDALKGFLVDDGVGRDPQFWNLAQALSALYPAPTDEKRWVDGVLARKKGLGL